MRPIPFDADKERTLKLGFYQIMELQEELAKNENVSEMRAMLQTFLHALKHEEPDLTLEKVGDILDAAVEKHGFEYVGKKMEELMAIFKGVEEPKKGKK